jgi:hypothetical protein
MHFWWRILHIKLWLKPLPFQICDFIRTEKIKSLIDYIVTKFLSPSATPTHEKSLEDIANSHVDTFKQLRKKHEENTVPPVASSMEVEAQLATDTNSEDHPVTLNTSRPVLNKKALEDQVSLMFSFPYVVDIINPQSNQNANITMLQPFAAQIS